MRNSEANEQSTNDGIVVWDPKEQKVNQYKTAALWTKKYIDIGEGAMGKD